MLKLLRNACTLESLGKINKAILTSRYSYSTASALDKNVAAATVEQSETSNSNTTDQSNDSSHFDENPPQQRRKSAYLNDQEEAFTPYRFVYPEFLPDPNLKYRNRVREKLERMDMLKRRSNIEIPEFYVGSILSVTVSDKHAPGKTTTFVGICIMREGNGLRSSFTLRNIVDGHGVEILYDLYNPTILNITCLRLERRLDEDLRYLRDAPPEYSTFPFDMVPELRSADAPVPINPIKVKLNPKPWSAKWHLWHLKGIEDISSQLGPGQLKRYDIWKFQTGHETKEYDLMKTYRSTIPAEYQTEIYSEVHQQLDKLTASLRKQKKKRTFVKPQRTV